MTDPLPSSTASGKVFASEGETSLENVQLTRLLDTLFERFGLDFRNYSYALLKRRVTRWASSESLASIEELRCKLLDDPAALERFTRSLTVHVTSMFRDTGFYRAIREKVIPVWRTYPFIRLWVAGCSSGEEVYSLAILLHEEGLYPRCRVYATDVSETILAKAKSGIFPLSAMQEYTRAYHEAGGRADFSDYYTADREAVVFRPFLRENTIFAAHNLVGDASFNEFHGIFCRNVMIYFNRELQSRVHELFYDSLTDFGYLGLGRSETIRYTARELNYEPISARERLFRKIR